MSLAYEALGALLSSLTADRRAHINSVAESLVKLRLPQESSDAILGALIIECAEVQFIEDGGAVPPVRDSTLDLLKPVLDGKKKKKDRPVSN